MKRAVLACAALAYSGACIALTVLSARSLHGTVCQDVYFGYQQVQARTSMGLSLPVPVVQMCGNRALPLLLIALTIAACAGWSAMMLRMPRRWIAAACACVGLVCAMAFPYVPSTDPYAYALYGYKAAHGMTPYAASHDVRAPGDLYRLFPPGSSNRVANYGPIAVLQYQAIAFAAGNSLRRFVFLQRLFNAALLVLLAWLLRFVRPPKIGGVQAAWTAFHPLLLLESVAFGHGDILMIVLLCAALAAYRKGSPALCAALIVLGTEVRLVAALALAVLFIELSRRNARSLVAASFGAAATLLVTAAAATMAYGKFTFGGAPAIEAFSSPAILAFDAFGVSMRHVGAGLVVQAAFGLTLIAVVLRMRLYRYLPFAALAALPIMRAWYCQWLVPLIALEGDRRTRAAALAAASLAIVAEYPAMTAHSDAPTWTVILSLQWLVPAAVLVIPRLSAQAQRTQRSSTAATVRATSELSRSTR